MTKPKEKSPARRPEQLLERRGGAVELLRLPALLFGAISSLRGALYDRGLLPSARADVPVICVGNISAGGTGKTPMVVWLAKRLAAAGLRPGILSRGYGKGGVAGAESDEAKLYGELLGELPRVAMADRIAGVQQLVEQGAGVVLMDDGFQHRRLRRDLDLVLMDATRPWGLPAPTSGSNRKPVKAFLPRGLLRESERALLRAGAIVITRSDQVDEAALQELEAELERAAPAVPRLLGCAIPKGVRALFAGPGELALGDLRGTAVDLVSAIGNPTNFEATMDALGARIQGHRIYPDHHEYAARDLAGLGGDAAVARPIVTTAKDAVKLAQIGAGSLGCSGPVWVLDIDFELTRGVELLDALLSSLPEGRVAHHLNNLREGLHG